MRDRHAALVAVADRVGRARHRLRDAERAAGAADERRLAGAELAGDGDDVARRRVARRRAAASASVSSGERGLDLGGQNRPSCTATGSGSRLGLRLAAPARDGAGSHAAPISAGICAKSSSSTLSIAGV